MLITNSSYVISSPSVDKCPAHELAEYAFIGRSNVGKSSLINMLTHHEGLAKTSQKPGKTLTINHFLISSTRSDKKQEQWHLVDLPGYGYARTGQAQRESLRRMIEGYCLRREQLVCLFVLVDARLEPQKIDLEFIEWCGEQGVPFAIVFTKADKLGNGRLKMNIHAYEQKLRETWEELPPIFATSSETGFGGAEILDYIDSIHLSLEQQ